MKRYTVTIPTTGYKTYEVAADSAAEAQQRLKDHDRGIRTKGLLKEIEECAGDWTESSEWEIEEAEDDEEPEKTP
jgi:hypothetical protein